MIDKAQNPAHTPMHGPASGAREGGGGRNSEWPRDDLAVKGDVVYISFKTQKRNEAEQAFLTPELAFGYRFTVTGLAMEKPMGWIGQIYKTTIHCAGLLIAVAIRGRPPSRAEAKAEKLLSLPAVQGGLVRPNTDDPNTSTSDFKRYKKLTASLDACISPGDMAWKDTLLGREPMSKSEETLFAAIKKQSPIGEQLVGKISRRIARMRQKRRKKGKTRKYLPPWPSILLCC